MAFKTCLVQFERTVEVVNDSGEWRVEEFGNFGIKEIVIEGFCSFGLCGCV